MEEARTERGKGEEASVGSVRDEGSQVVNGANLAVSECQGTDTGEGEGILRPRSSSGGSHSSFQPSKLCREDDRTHPQCGLTHPQASPSDRTHPQHDPSPTDDHTQPPSSPQPPPHKDSEMCPQTESHVSDVERRCANQEEGGLTGKSGRVAAHRSLGGDECMSDDANTAGTTGATAISHSMEEVASCERVLEEEGGVVDVAKSVPDGGGGVEGEALEVSGKSGGQGEELERKEEEEEEEEEEGLKEVAESRSVLRR